jgi:Ca-activated chloride channel family protein
MAVGQGGQDDRDKADQGAPGAVMLRSMSEQDQNSEQALRMVPDDPAGLLRARIRAYYGGSGAAVQDEDK